LTKCGKLIFLTKCPKGTRKESGNPSGRRQLWADKKEGDDREKQRTQSRTDDLLRR